MGRRVVPLYTAPPALVVPEFETCLTARSQGGVYAAHRFVAPFRNLMERLLRRHASGERRWYPTNEDTKGDVQVRELTMLIKHWLAN